MKKSKKKYYLVYWIYTKKPCLILEMKTKYTGICIHDFNPEGRPVDVLNNIFYTTKFKDKRELSIHEFIAFKLGGKIA